MFRYIRFTSVEICLPKWIWNSVKAQSKGQRRTLMKYINKTQYGLEILVIGFSGKCTKKQPNYLTKKQTKPPTKTNVQLTLIQSQRGTNCLYPLQIVPWLKKRAFEGAKQPTESNSWEWGVFLQWDNEMYRGHFWTLNQSTFPLSKVV